MHRFAVLGRFLATRSSGPRALQVGLPLYFAVGIVATVVFATSGLDASTVVRRAEGAVLARLVLVLAWTVAALPVMRGILSAESNLFLRSAPIARWQIVVWLGVLMFVGELPWVALWTRGGGVMSGLGATLTVLALHACILARVWTTIDAALATATCVAWLSGPPWVRTAVAAITSVIALPRAWQRLPEIRASGARSRIGGRPVLALARAYAWTAVRRHAATLLRAALIVTVGMGWIGLAVINDEGLRDDSTTLLRVTMSGWIPSCILATATPLGPILRTESAAEWVLSTCAVALRQRRAATVGLVAVAGGAVGLLAGVALGAALHAELHFRAIFAASLAATGALLSGLTEACVRWATREDGHDAARLVFVLAALIAVAEVVVFIS
jgi:hypothetical protein